MPAYNPTRGLYNIGLRPYDRQGDISVELNIRGEIYMTKGRITTLDERIEIVKWCLDHDRSIKDTASHFACSYAQVRAWLLKYEEFGEEGLIDKRGKPKEEKDLSELELAQRKIQSLKKENEKLKRMNDILKKAESLERW